MTLVVGPTAPTPGLHALVIGASQYTHLPSWDEPPQAASWNLQSLGACAIAAASVAQWLRDSSALLARPLKTLDVLLSPTVEEVGKIPGWLAAVEAPTRANVKTAIRRWRDACKDDTSSVGLFYFAGHGFSRGRGDHNLLLACSDLFDPAEARLANTILASNVFNGMAPQALGEVLARNQFFFFDCCRTFPAQVAVFDDRSVTPVLDVFAVEGVKDDRAYGRWYAAQDNASAYASVGKGTTFGRALLDTLIHSGRNELGRGWLVDAEAISMRLKARYAGVSGQALIADESTPGPLLRHLAAPPAVDLDIHLDPGAEAVGREVGLRVPAGLLTPGIAGAQVGQHSIQVPPGFYDVHIRGPAFDWAVLHSGLTVSPALRSPLVFTGWP